MSWKGLCVWVPKIPPSGRERAVFSPLEETVKFPESTFPLVLRFFLQSVGTETPEPVLSGGSNGGSSNSTSGGGGGGGGDGGGGHSFGADEFLEMHVHVRRWNFMARKGLNKLTPKFGLINVSVAFLIEGRADAEVRRARMGLDSLAPRGAVGCCGVAACLS